MCFTKRQLYFCLLFFKILIFSQIVQAGEFDPSCARLFEIKNPQRFIEDAPNSLLRTRLQYFITEEGESIAILKLSAEETPKSKSDFEEFLDSELLRDLAPTLNEVTTILYPIDEIINQVRNKRFLQELPFATAPWTILVATDIIFLTPLVQFLNIPPDQMSMPLLGVANVIGAGAGLIWFVSQMYDLTMAGVQDHYIKANDPRVKKLAHKRLIAYFNNENKFSKAQGVPKPKLLVINDRDIPKYFTDNPRYARTDLVNFIVQTTRSDNLHSYNIFSSSLDQPLDITLSTNYIAPVYSLRIQQIHATDKNAIADLQDFFDLKYSTATIAQEITKLNKNPVYAVYAQNMDSPAAIFQWVLNEKNQVTGIRYLEKEFRVSEEHPEELLEKILKTLGFQTEEIQTILKDHKTFLEDKNSDKQRKHLIETATRIQNMLQNERPRYDEEP